MMRLPLLLSLVIASIVTGCGEAPESADTSEGALGGASTSQNITMRIAAGAAATRIFDKVIRDNADLVRSNDGFEELTIDAHTLACNGATGQSSLCLLTFKSNRDPSPGATFVRHVGREFETAQVFANTLYLGLGATPAGGVDCGGAPTRMPLAASCVIEGTVTEVRRSGTQFGGRYRTTEQ